MVKSVIIVVKIRTAAAQHKYIRTHRWYYACPICSAVLVAIGGARERMVVMPIGMGWLCWENITRNNAHAIGLGLTISRMHRLMRKNAISKFVRMAWIATPQGIHCTRCDIAGSLPINHWATIKCSCSWQCLDYTVERLLSGLHSCKTWQPCSQMSVSYACWYVSGSAYVYSGTSLIWTHSGENKWSHLWGVLISGVVMYTHTGCLGPWNASYSWSHSHFRVSWLEGSSF